METVICSETSINFYLVHGDTFKKTLPFTVTDVGTLNETRLFYIMKTCQFRMINKAN
jgi:hypothetical protein